MRTGSGYNDLSMCNDAQTFGSNGAGVAEEGGGLQWFRRKAMAMQRCRRDVGLCHGCGCRGAGVTTWVVRLTTASDKMSWAWAALDGGCELGYRWKRVTTMASAVVDGIIQAAYDSRL